MGVRRCEHLAGACVLDDPGARVHRRHGRSGGLERSREDQREQDEEPPHLMRTRSPMCSDVEVAFGLRRAIVFAGTPVFLAITLNVSPACTV